ncbi:HAD-IIIA family hydrolase [Mycobacterium sp.]|jgi:histidinol-phosphate phosphatase family protein|uniref:HAD-IIIA family hydrolase n=1 Tax=Mycobacterium sp. TaxID=1785 RepID=UPI002D48B69B|nr:HAD-IIIA family hydrolase [Mycobacterium sp.]HZA12024.1 HAD-IIIA family hydrolase [Mycobacterium sp.]
MSACPTDFAVVIPTIGRASLGRLLTALDTGAGPPPAAVIVVDDRPVPAPLELPPMGLPVKVVRSGGRGPAAARNTGWRSTSAEWICFIDDDVVPDVDWRAKVAADLDAADSSVAGVQARIVVPQPCGRRPTDDERRTLGLATAQWITADMAYRRSALVACGGFDERFPRAYREDADIGLRITRSGGRIVKGARRSTHPVPARRPSPITSVRAQVGNRDDALMRRKHGRCWREHAGAGAGRMRLHALTTAAAVVAAAAAVIGWWRVAAAALLSWLGLTADFAARRIAPGPRTRTEITAMAVSSALIPSVAVAQRLCGTWLFRRAVAEPPLAVLFDRDDTLIADGPFLNDPDGVVPIAGAVAALKALRAHGLLVGVVTNQSGVARGLITPEQLTAVNARVDELLGPFDDWQICVHDVGDGCRCRKPAPGMVIAAADALGVDPGRCVVIGDTGGDVGAATAAGARAILIPTRRTRREEIADARATGKLAGSLDEAVSLVLGGPR